MKMKSKCVEKKEKTSDSEKKEESVMSLKLKKVIYYRITLEQALKGTGCNEKGQT